MVFLKDVQKLTPIVVFNIACINSLLTNAFHKIEIVLHLYQADRCLLRL